jgi:Nucleotidyl transferase AbiEii toxin, Type IV TA system
MDWSSGKVEENRAILRVSLPSSTARLSQSEAHWSAIADLANSVCIAWPQVSDGTNHQADLRRLVVLNLK